AALAINRKNGQIEAFLLCKIFAGLQDGVVFDGRRDQVPAFALERSSSAKNGEIDAFSAAAGENHFAGLAFEDPGRPLSGFVKKSPGATADVMDTRRIAPDLAQKRQHRFANLRIERCGGVVIKINRAHSGI